EVVAVVGADDRKTELTREREELAIHALLGGEVVVLELDVVAAVEDVGQLLGRAPRALGLAGGELVRHLAAQTARERDEPAVQLVEQVLVDARLVVGAFAEARGKELGAMAVGIATG